MKSRVSFALMMVATMLAGSTFAVRHIGFETDAFNLVYPADHEKSVIFSPLSFEVDSVLVAESLATIPKANVAERMGVIVGFENVYGPMLAQLSARTNGFTFVTARGFCVPEIKKSPVSHRLFLESVYGAEVMRLYPPKGAETWFRTTMEGRMDDFTLGVNSSVANRYSFYDLAALDVEWAERFPLKNTKRLTFTAVNGDKREFDFMADVRNADVGTNRFYQTLRLPLKNDAWFFALLPNEGMSLKDARDGFSSMHIDETLLVMDSIAEPSVYHGPCVVALPQLELDSSVDFTSIFKYFKIPTKGLIHVTGDELAAREYRQRAAFRLKENGRNEPPLERKAPEAIIKADNSTRRMILNRPFLFFVYHRPTATIPIAGQFTGL